MDSTRTIFSIAAAFALIVRTSGIATGDDAFDPGAEVAAAVRLIEHRHLTRKSLDDDLSRRWLYKFIECLDPRRMYFLESDLEEFRRDEHRLDDFAMAGDFQFPRLVRKRYTTRVDEAASYAESFLSVEHDFSVNDAIPVRFETYATNPDDLQERWRLRIKLELLIEELHGRQNSDVRSQLSGRYQRISQQASTMNDERLCHIYLNSLTAMYDPHSHYVSPAILMSAEQTMTFMTFDLGLRWRQRDGHLMITSLHRSIRGSETQNRLVGWSLIAIRRLNGDTLDLVEMDDHSLNDLIGMPWGPLKTDTEVILELMNPVTLERVTMTWNRLTHS